MKYLYIFLIVGLLSCKQGCRDSTQIKSDDGDTGKKAAITPAQRFELDSIPAEDPKLAEQLSGFKKDSLLMRIRFQQDANTMDDAFQKGDVDTYLRFALPSLVKGYGGLDKMRAKYATDMKGNPAMFDKILSGPVTTLGEVLDLKGKSSGWYCLMPQLITFKREGRTLQAEGLMVGYSPDARKCYYVDISNVSDEKVYYLLPDLYHIVPELPKRGEVFVVPQ